MRTLLQRVSKGSVTVTGQVISEIGPGLVILVGVGANDGEAQADWLAEKAANLRIFPDDLGKMNRSLLEAGGSALVVSQFTLYANVEKGRRPSFIEAAAPEQADPLIDYFGRRLRALGVPVKTGQFRAEMLVEIHNDGPVTILLE